MFIGLMATEGGEVDRFPFGLPPGEFGRFACRRLGVPKFLRWQDLLLWSVGKEMNIGEDRRTSMAKRTWIRTLMEGNE